MEYLRKQKKVLCGSGVFLLIMLALTVVSKAVYAYSLPQVTVVSPQKKSITHRVEAQGIVLAGRKKAVVPLAGLRVRSVLVNAGDRVEAGTPLFEIDTDDLSKMISEKEKAADEMALRISDLEKNEGLAGADKKTASERAQEDYDRTVFEWQVRVERAEDELKKAKRRLKEYEDDDGDDDSPEHEALTDAVEAAEETLQNAEWDASSARLEAGRKLEDAGRAAACDSSLEIERMKLKSLAEEISGYRKLAGEGGVVSAKEAGVITQINVMPGERTPDGAAVLYADLGSPLMFRATLSREEKKHVGLYDPVRLELGMYFQADHRVDYLAESEGSPGMYEAAVTLGEDEAEVGLSGSLIAEKKSEPYRCCIPVGALRSDGRNQRYVYVIEKRSGILGDELAVRAVYVRVADENDSFAALEDSSIDSETQIVLSATKELKDGIVVRMMSPE